MKLPPALFLPITAALFCSSCGHLTELDNRSETLIHSRGPAIYPSQKRFVERQAPNYLTFDELVSLSEEPHPTGRLGEKLETFWRTPLIDNRAHYAGHRPTYATNEALGDFIRVATWNVENSFRIPKMIDALCSESGYLSQIDPEKAPVGSAQRDDMLRQRARLASADVLILQETDIGVNRSGYIDAAGALAKSLDMNYAHAAQALEIDPVILGLQPALGPDGVASPDDTEFFKADPARFRGVFGSAVLSRYPIKQVEVFQLETVGYDWYEEEKEKPAFLEIARRAGVKIAFKNTLTREIKAGNRHFFRVDLDVPGLPNDTLTVINVHLEIKCTPKVRNQQMQEILSHLKDIDHPVIFAGDFNSSAIDISPTSLTHVIRGAAAKPTTYLAIGANLADLSGANLARTSLNVLKNYHNPTARNIPVIAPNPIRPLINRVRDFRFDDGGRFDVRGERAQTINGHKGLLANSNHRRWKGHTHTFSLERPVAIFGRYRLDWIFVKPGTTTRPNGVAPLAPHYGETLIDFNKLLKEPLSDHHPCVVDLPLGS